MREPGGSSASPSPVARYVTIGCLLAFIAGYALAVFLTRAQWADGAPQEGTRVTFAAQTSDGAPPSTQALTKTQQVLKDRADELGGAHSEVVADGNDVTVTVPSRDRDAVRNLGQSGTLYLRPVIHVIAAGLRAGKSAPGSGDQAERIAEEKQLRQSTDQSIQVLALQFQATRCSDDDVLAGHDDPTLPLVTCSTDGKQVYLLDTSIISGDQLQRATAGRAQESDQYVVAVEFDRDAAEVWAKFTAANLGTQVGYTFDSRVISAPQIQEPITGGRTQISGFTADSARALADALNHGTLPLLLTVKSSDAVTLPPSPGSTPVRIGLIAGGLVVLSAVAFGGWYLVRPRYR